MSQADSERRYSDEEFSRILRRAVEIEGRPTLEPETPTLPLPPSDGLTLTEIQEIAREAGIDPAAVADAASTLGLEEPSPLAILLGGAPKMQVERFVPGHPSSEQMSVMIDQAREILKRDGDANEVLGGLEWRFQEPGESSTFIQVAPRGGGTRIRISVNRAGQAFLSYWVPMAASAVIAGITLGVIEPSTLGAHLFGFGGALAAGYGVGRTIWRHSTRGWNDRLERLLRAMTRTAQNAAGEIEDEALLPPSDSVEEERPTLPSPDTSEDDPA
jgi:hypothetical protein